MNPELNDPRMQDEQARYHVREQKIRKFFKELTQWAGTSIVLVGINIMTTGGFTWAKWPVFIWGLVVAAQALDVIRMYKLNRDWEQRRWQQVDQSARQLGEPGTGPVEDHSESLLGRQPEREKLSDYRELKKPWKEDDLV